MVRLHSCSPALSNHPRTTMVPPIRKRPRVRTVNRTLDGVGHKHADCSTTGKQTTPTAPTPDCCVPCLLLNQVIVALLLGIWSGALLACCFNPLTAFLRTFDTYFVGAFTGEGNAAVLLFTFLLGGTIGLVQRSGGALGLANSLKGFMGRVSEYQSDRIPYRFGCCSRVFASSPTANATLCCTIFPAGSVFSCMQIHLVPFANQHVDMQAAVNIARTVHSVLRVDSACCCGFCVPVMRTFLPTPCTTVFLTASTRRRPPHSTVLLPTATIFHRPCVLCRITFGCATRFLRP